MTNKTVKWTSPVEIDGSSGEYYAWVPSEVLNELKWFEGDSLEWIPNGDSYIVRKV